MYTHTYTHTYTHIHTHTHTQFDDHKRTMDALDGQQKLNRLRQKEEDKVKRKEAREDEENLQLLHRMEELHNKADETKRRMIKHQMQV